MRIDFSRSMSVSSTFLGAQAAPDFEIAFAYGLVHATQVFDQAFARLVFSSSDRSAIEKIDFDHGQISAAIKAGDVFGAFSVSDLSPQDDLEIEFHSEQWVYLAVRHQRDALEKCVVTCADGSQGRPCARCRGSDGLVIHICC